MLTFIGLYKLAKSYGFLSKCSNILIVYCAHYAWLQNDLGVKYLIKPATTFIIRSQQKIIIQIYFYKPASLC